MTFMMMIRAAVLSLILLITIATTIQKTHAQTAPLPIAALTNGDIVLHGLNGASQPITRDGAMRNYRDPFWSPSGTLLGFTDVGENDSGIAATLYVSDLSGRPPVAVATNLHPLLTPRFSPDGLQLVYATSVSGGVSGPVQVFSYSPTAATAPVPLGTFDFNANCVQDTYAIPPDRARNRELRIRAGIQPLLIMTTFGVLHAASCSMPDVALLNPINGQDQPLFQQVVAVFVSPEQARAVVVDAAGTFTFVNTERGPYTQLMPAARPDQVGFGLPESNEVFYSTVDRIGATPLPDGVQPLIANTYTQLPSDYHVTIRRFSLRTGRDDVLYSADAYSIGNLQLTPDGSTLVFSQIPNPGAWVQAIAAGQVDAADEDAALGFFEPEIYALSLADNSVQYIATGWYRFTINAAGASSALSLPLPTTGPMVEPTATFTSTFTPIPLLPTATLPPTLTPQPEGVEAPTVSPSGITIGAEMTINPGIGTINVRRQPGTGSRVVELVFGGERVTVLEGPQDAEGFIWWHIRLPSGADGWIAETLAGQQTLLPD